MMTASWKKITCPQKLQSIGENAFGGCGSLAEVELNDGLKEIGVLAFCGSGIRSIDIKDSVTNLEQYAFYYCKDLQNVRLGKGIKRNQRLHVQFLFQVKNHKDSGECNKHWPICI